MKDIFICLFGISAIALAIHGAANWLDMQPPVSSQKFEVVDTYGGCDVVRYNPDYSAHYTYLLHCKK
jgi:hypothetical protein